MLGNLLLCLGAIAGSANAQQANVLQPVNMNFRDTTQASTGGLCLSNQQSGANVVLYTSCGGFQSTWNYASFSFGQAYVVSGSQNACLTLPEIITPSNTTDQNAVIITLCSANNRLQRFGYNSAAQDRTDPNNFPVLVSSDYEINNIRTPVCVRPCLINTNQACAFSQDYIVSNGLGDCNFANLFAQNSAIQPEFLGLIPGFGTTTTDTTFLQTVTASAFAPSTNFINVITTIFVSTRTQTGGLVFVTTTSTNQQVFTEATETTNSVTQTDTITAIVNENTTIFIANGVQTTPVEGGLNPIVTGTDFPVQSQPGFNPFSTSSQFNPFQPATTSAFNPFQPATTSQFNPFQPQPTSVFNPFAPATSAFNPFATTSVFNPFATSTVFNPFQRSGGSALPQPRMNTDAADGGMGVFYKQANQIMRKEEAERNRYAESEDDAVDPGEFAYPQNTEAVHFTHANSQESSALSIGAVVAIAVACGVLVLLCVGSMVAIGYNWYQKRKSAGNKGAWDGDSVTSDVETVSVPPSAMSSNKKGGLVANDGESDLVIPGSFVV